MKVVTEFINPPIPLRRFDWQAHIPGQEEHGPVGQGQTEVEALRDLCEQFALLYYERTDP